MWYLQRVDHHLHSAAPTALCSLIWAIVSPVSRADQRMGCATAQKEACASIGALESVVVAHP